MDDAIVECVSSGFAGLVACIAYMVKWALRG